MPLLTKEPHRTTLQLSGKSRLTFTWAQPGLLSIELWGPGTDRYGHGMMLKEACMLSGDELTSFLAGLSDDEPHEAA
jgi:hypothetical protein